MKKSEKKIIIIIIGIIIIACNYGIKVLFQILHPILYSFWYSLIDILPILLAIPKDIFSVILLKITANLVFTNIEWLNSALISLASIISTGILTYFTYKGIKFKNGWTGFVSFIITLIILAILWIFCAYFLYIMFFVIFIIIAVTLSKLKNNIGNCILDK